MTSIQLFALVVLFVLTALNYYRYNDALYPPVLQGALWLIVLLLFILYQDAFIPLSNTMYYVVMIGVITFTIGSYLATYNYFPILKKIDLTGVLYNKTLVGVLFWISIIGLPLFIYIAYTLGREGMYDSFFRNLRAAVSGDEQESFSMLGYLVTASFIATWMLAAVYFTTGEKFKLFLSLLVSILYSFFAVGRTYFILLAIPIVAIMTVTRRISLLKAVTYIIVVGFMVFVFMGTLLAKGAELDGNFAENIVSMFESFRAYLLGSLPAFDLYMQRDFHPAYGENIFRTILAIMHKLNSNVDVPSLVKDYELVPFPTNVYTIYLPYYQDYYIFGILGVQFIAGYWHGFLYKKATKGSLYFIILYSVFLYPLFMQFFQDQYMSLLSSWVQISVGLLICIYSIKRIDSKKGNYAFS
jgi:oligosaccharide repeat unit polymerase